MASIPSDFEVALLNRYGVDKLTALELLALGITIDDIPDLQFAGVSPEDVRVYAELGFISRKDIIQLAAMPRGENALDDIRQFRSQGITAQAHLIDLVNSSIKPQQTAPYTRLGIVYFLTDLIRADVPASIVAEYRALGVGEIRAMRLFAAGVSSAMVKKYLNAGIDPITMNDDVLTLVKHNITPTDIRHYIVMGLPVGLLCSGLEEGVSPDKFIPYIKRGYDPKSVDLLSIAKNGISLEKLDEYRQAGIKDFVIPKFIDLGINPQQARDYAEVHIWNPYDVKKLVQAGVATNYFKELGAIGVKISFISDEFLKNPVPIDIAKSYKDNGIVDLSDVIRLLAEGVPPEVAVQYKTSSGDIFVYTDTLVRHGVSATEFGQFIGSLEHPEDLYNKDARMELIAKRRFLPTLHEEYGIDERTFKRYSFEVLEQLMKVKKKGIDHDKKIALVVNPKSDWNGAFGNTFVESQILEESNLIVAEITDINEIGHTARRYAEKHGKVDLLVISGHGTQNSILFGYDDDNGKLDSRNLKKIIGVGEYLSKEAVIVLRSCSTGVQGPAQRCIGQRLADALNRVVYAPLGSSKLETLTFDKKEGVVVDVRYDVPHAIYKPRPFRNQVMGFLSRN